MRPTVRFDLHFPAQGNILIVSEDGDSSDPDDADVQDPAEQGEQIDFDFTGFGTEGAVIVNCMVVGDIEREDGESAEIRLYGAANVLLQTIEIPNTGDNVKLIVDVSQAGVERMEVDLNGSGMIDDICVTAPPPPPPGCWMAGGGVKFAPRMGAFAGEVDEDQNGRGPLDSVGGGVFPGCDPDPSNGGQWNYVAHTLGLHFQGFDIDTVRCGNVQGIEPGSESPVTPFNFIEFEGTGRLQGIGGNKVHMTNLHFFGRVEDRNEPGNARGAKDGDLADRYLLHVFSDPNDPVGTTLLNVDMEGDPSTNDPLIITGGNFQLHISSCPDQTGDGGGAAVNAAESGWKRPDVNSYFRRGDSNVDGSVDLSDSVFTLLYLFRDDREMRCEEAADANDDGNLNFADPVMTLQRLYMGGPPLPLPVVHADFDPTEDDLGCRLFR